MSTLGFASILMCQPLIRTNLLFTPWVSFCKICMRNGRLLPSHGKVGPELQPSLHGMCHLGEVLLVALKVGGSPFLTMLSLGNPKSPMHGGSLWIQMKPFTSLWYCRHLRILKHPLQHMFWSRNKQERKSHLVLWPFMIQLFTRGVPFEWLWPHQHVHSLLKLNESATGYVRDCSGGARCILWLEHHQSPDGAQTLLADGTSLTMQLYRHWCLAMQDLASRSCKQTSMCTNPMEMYNRWTPMTRKAQKLISLKWSGNSRCLILTSFFLNLTCRAWKMVTLPCRGFKIGGTDTHLDPRSAFILMNQAVIIKIRNAQPPLLRLSFVFMRLGTSPVPLVPNPTMLLIPTNRNFVEPFSIVNSPMTFSKCMRQSEAIAQKSLFFSIPFQQQSKPQGIGLFFGWTKWSMHPELPETHWDTLWHSPSFPPCARSSRWSRQWTCRHTGQRCNHKCCTHALPWLVAATHKRHICQPVSLVLDAFCSWI